MPLSLSTSDGDEVEVQPVEMPADVADARAAFDRVVGSNPTEDEKQRPPRRPVVDKTDPGYTPEPAKRGRPRKEDAARTTTKAETAKASKEPLKPKDFTKGLTDFTDAIWMGTGMIPVPASQMTSVLLKANQPQIVATLNAGAQSNRVVRNVVEKVTGDGGGSMWVLSLGMLGYGMYMQAKTLSENPELMAQVVEANTQAVQLHMQQVFGIPQEQAQVA